MIQPPRFNVLGVSIAATDYRQATALVVEAAHARQPFAVAALAVHGVMSGALDATHRRRLNRLDLLVPDGQPVCWALRWLHGVHLASRVYGPFLMRHVCAQAAAEGLGVFLYGSDNTTLHALHKALVAEYPGLRIAGVRASRFKRATDAEWAGDIAAIRAADPDIVFCGLGCPRQEMWVDEMRAELGRPLLAVGAAFPLLSGRRPMAPAWMQHAGLEWIYRLAHEPRRLWRRYLVYNPLFLGGVLLQMLRLKRSVGDDDGSPLPAERWS
ncbi:MAG TPA: WecB/TagA/CpsF family glycosyltransferase [Opitutaceae bacterium]|nr:WecB/TagA/CpsF family glycosyltransferase [Opitutaceae bacterium]